MSKTETIIRKNRVVASRDQCTYTLLHEEELHVLPSE